VHVRLCVLGLEEPTPKFMRWWCAREKERLRPPPHSYVHIGTGNYKLQKLPASTPTSAALGPSELGQDLGNCSINLTALQNSRASGGFLWPLSPLRKGMGALIGALRSAIAAPAGWARISWQK